MKHDRKGDLYTCFRINQRDGMLIAENTYNIMRRLITND